MTTEPLPPQLAIRPVTQPLNAVVRVPGSKSLTNRALIVAALADGSTRLRDALFSDDSRYCAEALTVLGFAVRRDADAQTVDLVGQGGRLPASRAELFIGNAGTAARFLTALLTLGRGEYVLDGNTRMRERPLADLLSALTQLGATVASDTGCPPVRVIANGLPGGCATVGGEVSSQFLSGLLLSAPYARSPVELVVSGVLNSAPYVDLTLGVMADFGVTVEREGYARFHVMPQHYVAHPEYVIEGDASAASYFFAAPAIAGGTVRVANLSRAARQGDVAFVDVLAQMGCRVAEVNGGLAVSAPADSSLRGVDVDLRHIPDTAQTLAAVAPFAASPTRLRGIASARRKETDRVTAMCVELQRLGVAVEEHTDGLTIYPAQRFGPAVIQTYDDHRMAMAFALIGLRAPGIVIDNPACVSKTFPDYFAVLESLRPA
ncbi:MAG: 3-phosphoshikimate 1-carboxyvinyltransferase [Anaerolineales bacterium]|nr:3-phosphoshikimate 1-carboxyvinyltransferase [Anaerolineales bacterium]